MIDIEKHDLFPKISRGIFIASNSSKKYNVIFYSENSNFFTTYPLLGIKKQYVKRITALSSKIPYLKITSDMLLDYKKLKLNPVIKETDNDDQNLFIDCSYFLDILDFKYTAASYNRSIVLNKIIDYLNSCKSLGGSDRRSILLYHVDISKELPSNLMFRRLWPILNIAKETDGKFPFDFVLVCFTYSGVTRYFLIYSMNFKTLPYNRIFSIMKSIKKGKTEDNTQQQGIE